MTQREVPVAAPGRNIDMVEINKVSDLLPEQTGRLVRRFKYHFAA